VVDLRERSAKLTKARRGAARRAGAGSAAAGARRARVHAGAEAAAASVAAAQAAKKYRDALAEVAEAERAFAGALGGFAAGAARGDADEARRRCPRRRSSPHGCTAAPPHALTRRARRRACTP
jgi:hypothetical protein